MKACYLASVLMIVAAFAVSAYFYPSMPEKMASHWDAPGQANGSMGKDAALFFVPVLQVLLLALLIFLPKIMPLEKNFKKMEAQYGWLVFGILAFMLYVHLLTIAWNLGIAFSMGQALPPAFAALFFMIGAIMQKSRRNWVLGIRTPWTMSSDAVWEKTHALGGKLFKASGCVALLGMVFPESAIGLILAPVISSAIICFVYSYLEYAKKKKK